MADNISALSQQERQALINKLKEESLQRSQQFVQDKLLSQQWIDKESSQKIENSSQIIQNMDNNTNQLQNWDDIVNKDDTQETQEIKQQNSIISRLDQMKQKLNEKLSLNLQMKSRHQQTNRELELQQQNSTHKLASEKQEIKEQKSSDIIMTPDLSVQQQQKSSQILQQQQEAGSGTLSVKQIVFGAQSDRAIRNKSFDDKNEDVPEIQQKRKSSLSPKRDFNFSGTQYITELVEKYGQKKVIQSQPSRRAKKTEEEYINQKKFTFQPKVNDLPRNIYSYEEKKKIDVSKQDQWNRLLQSKNEIIEEREKLKIMKDDQQLQENCTFQPKINEQSQTITQRKSQIQDQMPVQERLYQQGVNKIKSIDQVKREYEDRINYPFKPDLKNLANQIQGEKAFEKPIYERIDEIMKKKQEELQSLQMSKYKDENCTFKPKINDASKKINQQKSLDQENLEVVDRLMQDAINKVQKRASMQDEQQQSLSQICTFAPQINPTAREELQQSQESQSIILNQKQFIERQYLMQDYIKEKLQQKIQQELNKCTFAPNINQVSNYLIEADQQRVYENQQDKCQRLAIKDNDKKQILIEQVQKVYYEQFNYQPSINKISSQLGRKHSIESLSKKEISQQKLNQMKAEQIKDSLRECSFQPKINKNKKYENVESQYQKEKIASNLALDKIKKEKKIQQLKSEKEYEDMQECTFVPKLTEIDQEINKLKLDNVKGIDKYLQFVQIKKKNILEQQQRENKIFHIERNYDIQKKSKKTLIQEFHLSKGSQKNFQMLKEELGKKEKDECTFQPNTNELKNKEKIRKILAIQDYQNAFEQNQYDKENQIQQQ